MQKIKNFSLFSNSGIGEYGTNNILLGKNQEKYKIETVLANELLEERANIFRDNYKNTNMISGSITDEEIQGKIIKTFLKEKPITGTFSPPCQGSSGLNAFKSSPLDFRNQLIKSVFKIFEKIGKERNTLKFGYIENVVIYYNEEIPALLYERGVEKLYNEYIEDENGNYLNYQYFIYTNNPEKYKNIINSKEIKANKNKFELNYILAFNKTDIKCKISELEKKLKNDKLIKPINTFEYIESSLKKYGFECKLKTIRGEEYGGCQVRQRGFVIFYKNGLNLDFPKKIYKKSSEEGYDGKTIRDALETLDLIKIIDIEEQDKYKELLKNKEYKIKDNKIYIDMSITEKEAEKELIEWKDNNYNNKIPNLHFRQKLKERFEIWLENTPEGKSAYKNKERINRPYKIIEVRKNKNNEFNVKNNQTFVVKEDSKKYFKENNILDYIEFVSEEMKKREGEKEWGEDGRRWQIKDIKDRKTIEEKAVQRAKELLIKNGEEYMYIFMPIKGFEAATYKRASLNKTSSALTTKNGIGNSNTCHPIFNRTWTPKEYMALFGIGYIYKNGEYIKSKEYIPPKNITKIRKFSNLIFEIHGEAIISTVAEQIMKSLLEQYIDKTNQ